MHSRRLCHVRAKNECYILQDTVETLIQVRWEAFTSRHGKFNPENMYQILSELALFCRRHDKTYWCVFRFTDSTAVRLQNANAKFHKVV